MNSKMIETGQPLSKMSLDGCVSSMNMHDTRRNADLQLKKKKKKVIPVLPSQRFIKNLGSPKRI
jgi:hypothetical protein